ncbi:hypothetical protein [Rhodobacter sp. 24-YEA-8]|uniref:hypothetical protein n=1 Tax=Rhodobacter sp. 24-YEA-8 TaxID=1884310 RepID=UPI000B8843CD|nr:hypothetical protein [Rhodobacter sp. 24-YEA-8]
MDALILAGGLANNRQLRWPDLLSRISNLIVSEMVYVLPDIHDYYHFRIDGDDVLCGLVEDAGKNRAQKRVLEIGGVMFICATFRTDFRLLGNRISARRAPEQSGICGISLAREPGGDPHHRISR